MSLPGGRGAGPRGWAGHTWGRGCRESAVWCDGGSLLWISVLGTHSQRHLPREGGRGGFLFPPVCPLPVPGAPRAVECRLEGDRGPSGTCDPTRGGGGRFSRPEDPTDAPAGPRSTELCPQRLLFNRLVNAAPTWHMGPPERPLDCNSDTQRPCSPRPWTRHQGGSVPTRLSGRAHSWSQQRNRTNSPPDHRHHCRVPGKSGWNPEARLCPEGSPPPSPVSHTRVHGTHGSPPPVHDVLSRRVVGPPAAAEIMEATAPPTHAPVFSPRDSCKHARPRDPGTPGLRTTGNFLLAFVFRLFCG